MQEILRHSLVARPAGDVMFFDDRLATVLRHRAAGENAARTQFRQLLDLLGNRKYGRDESLVAAAWLRLGALGEQIKPADRARMIREPGWRFRSPELAAHLAEDEPEVAAAALERAQLEDEDWEALIPRLPIRARGFLRLRRDLPDGAVAVLETLGIHDRGLPQPAIAEDERPADLPDAEEVAPEDSSAPDRPNETLPPIDLDEYLIDREAVNDDAPPEEEAETAPSENPAADQPSEIAALVERINNFRRERGEEPAEQDLSPRLPLDDDDHADAALISGFGFATDAAGRIEWADPHVAPMIIGKRLLKQRQLGASGAQDLLERAFSARQPIETAPSSLDGAPAIAGDWIVDAEPRFTRTGGRFQGYVGRFRRPVEDRREDPATREAERVRQLLHELRTPVNALQGFAEVIQQQLFGPAPHEYRALAANIASDSARILAGFDELERLARLESGAMDLQAGTTDIAGLVKRMAGQLQPVLAPRMAGIEIAVDFPEQLIVSVHSDEAEALTWRILATLAGIAGAGETIVIDLAEEGSDVLLSADLPERLRREEDVFAAQVSSAGKSPSAGLFGAGFSLRLASAEAAAARGSLQRIDGHIRLSLPMAPSEPGPAKTGSNSDENEDSEPVREAENGKG